MDRHAILERCRLMSVRELLRATTIDRGDYEPLFHQIAQAELGQRWHQVREIKGTVRIRLNDWDEEAVSPEQALERLDDEIQTWDAWILTNCLEDVLVLQKERAGWFGHHLREGAYVASFPMNNRDEAKRAALAFLDLEDVTGLFETTIDITQMIVLSQTNSRDLVDAAVDELQNRGIPLLVQTRAAHGLFHGDEESSRGAGYVLLAPSEHAMEAHEALKGIDTLIERLHKEAELFSERGDTDKEIQIYDRILRLAPADEIAFFNKGIALMETDRSIEAADCFVQAALVADQETAPRVEECLKELAAQLPENTDVLTALADLSRRRGDLEEARAHLEAVLSLQPENANAHLSLAHLFFDENLDDTHAVFHFKEYLRLNPTADDREVIEEMIRELEGQ